MCGRYTLRTPASRLISLFAAINDFDWNPRFNIAPTQRVACVRKCDSGRELVLLRWGLIPSWAKDVSIGSRMINARSETIATKPSFRAAFKRRRCLVVADGFYEWKKPTAKGVKTPKRPFLIGTRNGEPFAFAGLWESWQPTQAVTNNVADPAPSESGGTNAAAPIESCTIITTSPNGMMSDIHDRMPVILREDEYDLWLDVDRSQPDALQTLLDPYPEDLMTMIEVSTAVNHPRHDAPDCIEPLTPAP